MEEIKNVEQTNEYSIIFSNVQKAYGKTVVIEDLNLEIKQGERLILLGPYLWTGVRLIMCLRESAISLWFSKATLYFPI